MENAVINNTAKSRFELSVGDQIAYADYDNKGGVLHIKYVFAPETLRGTGAAGRVMAGVADTARAENLKILPICGYAAAWLRKHKEHHDLIA